MFSIAFRIRANSDFAIRQFRTLVMIDKGTTVVETFKLERNRTTQSSISNKFRTQTTPPSTNSAHKPHEKVVICACAC